MRTVSFFVFFLLSLPRLAAQDELDSLLKSDPFDGYYEKISDQIGIKVSLSNELHGFSVETDNSKTVILPNSAAVAKLILNFRSFSVAVIKFLPDITGDNSDDEEKGNTDSWGLTGNLNLRKFINRLSYQRTSGYYLDNTSDFVQDWIPGDPYIQFPDLHYWGIHGRSSFKWNKDFSFNAFHLQTERQLRSAGTVLPTVSYAYYVVDDRSPLPSPGRTSQKTSSFEFNVGIGYYHTLVFKNFYLTGGMITGFGSNISRTTNRTLTEDLTIESFEFSNRSPTTYYELTVGGGYNGSRFFAGFEINLEDTHFLQTGTTAQTDISFAQYQVFIGTRITAPKFLRTGSF